MKKSISKIFGGIVLVTGIITSYFIFTGRLDQKVNDTINKSPLNEKEINSDYSEEVPEGVIHDYKSKFEWIVEPLTDVYDPNSKIAENGAYGYAVDGRLWQAECMKKVNEYIKSGDIDLRLADTTENYNIKSVHAMNEEINVEPYKCLVKISNMQVNGGLDDFSSEFFVDDTYDKYRQIICDNSKVYEYAYDGNGQLIMKELNGSVKFVTFDVEIKAKSNWVEEIEAVPQLIRVSQKNEVINIVPPVYTFGEGNDFELTNPIYMDIGLYDLKNYGNNAITVVPMRKGESLKFKCGYLIPEEVINECMLTFNTPYYTDYFSDPFRILVKVE